MSGKGRIALRVAVALGAGVAVSAIAAVASWMEFGQLQPGGMNTPSLLRRIDEALEAYRTQTGSFPDSLSVVVADPMDVVCYAGGALVAVVFWTRALEMMPWQRASRPAPPP